MVAIGDIATNSIVELVIVAMTHIVATDYIATKYCVARTRLLQRHCFMGIELIATHYVPLQ